MKKLNSLGVKNFVVVALYLASQPISAQDLIPATSEDQEAFEQQIERAAEQAAAAQLNNKSSEVRKNSGDKVKPAKADFGAAVNEEAKKLKNAGADSRKEMGKLVSSQKRKNQTQAGGTAGSSGSGSNASSADKDGRNSAPGLNNTGGRPESPGQSGNRPAK